MATIDDKVVAMSFESSKFQSGVNSSLSSLDKLKAALKFPNAGKELSQINTEAKKISFSSLLRGIEEIKNRLNAMRLVAVAAFASIATRAIQAGGRVVKAFTLDPLKAGFSEYTTNLNAVQTILANTQAAGVGLKEVNAALLQLNQYSDKTIYNFSQMARNIGTFTAAGVDLDTSVNAIKGIANLAALSGSNAEQASTAMYQLSQALAAGSVKLQDWNSVVNAGMGGTVFQRALAQTAERMGTLEEGSVKLTGKMKNVTIAGEAFRQSLSTPGKASWLTSDVLTQTLQQFTGDLTDAQLKAKGFTDEQVMAIQATAKTAMLAATEVKTLSQVLDVAKETAGSGWAQTWQIIFGNFGEAKALFTGVSNAVNGFINASAQARNKVLGDWKALGGRTLLINSIKTAFQNLGAILKPIKDAFRDIFPAKTGKDLFTLTQRFAEFAKAIKPTETTIDGLRRTFRGFFALLSIGGQIISGIFTVFGQLFGAVGEGSGSFLDFTGSIGDFLVSVDAALKKGNRLHNFFKGIGEVLAAPIQLLSKLSEALINLFAGFSPGGISDELDGIAQSMSPLQRIVEGISNAWLRFLDALTFSGPALKPVLDAFVTLVSGLGTAIGQIASTMNFDAILEVIRTGLLVGLFVMFKKFLGKGTLGQMLAGAGGGILGNIAGSFDALRGSMVAMQQNIKAKTLKEIAIAIALLVASVVALSFVDPERLKSSLTAMTVAFAQLLGAMAILGNISKSIGFIKMPILAASLILLAGAITILSAAVVILAQLSWDELARGLGGVVVLLAAVSAAVIPLSANSRGMIVAGIGITAVAIAMNLLALAVRQFAGLSWSELAKGLGGVAVGLGVIAATMTVMPTARMVVAGVGLIALATGLNILALAIEKLGGMNWKVLGKGLAAVAGSLTAISLAMKLMPKSVVFTAAGLLLVALALQGIARAVEKMGGMSIEQIAKGLGTLAGSLVILAGALHLMRGTIGGSVALGLAASGLALLIPTLVLLGKQSWGTIVKGLVGLAGALAIIIAASALMSGAAIGLLAFGAAMVVIGAGLTLIGTGVALIAAGLSALAVAAPTGVGILVAAFMELAKALPEIMKNLAIGLLQMVQVFAAAAPQFVTAMGKILVMLLDIIIKSAPKMGEAFSALLKAGLKVLADNSPQIVATGLKVLLDLIRGIRNNIGQITTIVTDIVVKFLNTLSSNLGRIITAGTNLLISFVRGIANNIARVGTAALDIVLRFLATIASNLGRIATAGISVIVRFLAAIASRIGDVIRAGTNIIVNFVTGIGNAGARIVTAAVNAMTKFITAIAKGAVKMVDEGFKAIVLFLNGVADAIEKNIPAMRSAGIRIGVAIVDGMLFGLASKAGAVASAAAGLGKKALGGIGGALGIGSPSKEAFILGGFVVQGLANGLASSTKAVNSAKEIGNNVIQGFKDVFQIESPSKIMHQIGQFVGQGFANGLRSSTEDIRGAFADMNDKLTDAMITARETIAKEQEKLDKLREAKKPDEVAIKKSQDIIKQNENLLARAKAGHIALIKTLKDEKAELIGLANDYEKVGEKLKNAEKALVDAKRIRDDAFANFDDKYSTLPEIVRQDKEGKDISGEEQLATYLEALKNQADAVAAYQSTLDQLRKLGLDDETYQKLLEEGTANQQFADQLLAGGKTAVDSLNTLDSNLAKVSKTLATNAAKNLYQAGVDAAEGLVKGLKAKRSDIRQEMEEIAREMIRALKKELKIKSPSEAFAEIGRLSMAGMAKGFSNSKQVMQDSIDDAAANALAAMRSSMGRISGIVAEELNPSPIITPVLDLTQIQRSAGEMASIIKTPLTAAASFNQAATISSERNTAELDELLAASGGTSVKFEQNNFSPKALTEVEIYRQTKNQLSQLKSVLAT